MDGQETVKPVKKNMATILTLGIIIGVLIIIFAVNIILINYLPGENKWTWFWAPETLAVPEEMIYGVRVLIAGVVAIEFFFVLTLCIYIWKRGRNYLMKHI